MEQAGTTNPQTEPTVTVLDPRTEATVTIPRAGQVLKISRTSAYLAAKNGQIPTIRVGRRLLVPTARLLELLGQKAS